jgi:hypothetical protein
LPYDHRASTFCGKNMSPCVAYNILQHYFSLDMVSHMTMS